MTDTAIQQTEATAAFVEAQQQAALAAAEQAAMTVLQTYIQEGRAAVAQSAQVKTVAQTAAQRIIAAARSSLASAAERLTQEQQDEIDQLIEKLTPIVAQRFIDTLEEALEIRQGRIEEGDEDDDPESRRSWAANVGHTVAARLAAENSVDIAKPVEEHLGTKLHKLWMSRGDNKVRGSHRKLHGQTVELGKPFWRELGTGRTLSFPGDPSAPIEQTINCRCWLWYVPAEQSAEAEDTFQMPDSEFELIAASAYAHGELDDQVVIAAYDVYLGMAIVAATERKTSQTRRYEESAHERDATGKFAEKPKGSIPPKGFDREEWEARGGWDAVLRRYGKHRGDGKRRVGGAGGGSEKDEAKAAAKEALRVKQEAEREAERVKREQIRSERITAAERLRAQRRMEDARLRGERLSQDEALYQIQEEVKETERALREKQREADEAAREIERSRDYIRQMRLRGELPTIIEAERARLAELEGKHKKIVGEVEKLSEQSRKLGTSDTVRRLRDRVRFSRRAEDDAIRTDREQYDAAIRIAQQRQDAQQREREAAMRARQREERASLTGAGEPSTTCIICLLPVGDRQITYADGDSAPMHMTLGYMGDSAGWDDIDREMYSIAAEEIADRIPPFTAKVAGQATLGEDGEAVALIEAPEIAAARDYVMRDGALGYAIGQADEHPNFIPHVTGLGDVDYQDGVKFDRLGLWVGDNRQEYPLNG